MENEAFYEKKVCDVKRFIKCFYIRICNQNVIFHEKNYFSFILTFILIKTQFPQNASLGS